MGQLETRLRQILRRKEQLQASKVQIKQTELNLLHKEDGSDMATSV